jgi:hypothetical protein
LSPIARPRGGLAASDLLARVRAEIDARCDELRPALVEYERLLLAAEAIGLDLDGAPAPVRVPRPSTGKAAARRAPARKTATAKEPAAKASVREASTGKPSAPAAATEALDEISADALRPRARGKRGSAAGAIVRAASPPARGGRAAVAKGAKKAGGQRDAAQQAIVAALEHGSHTVAELGVVTAMSGASIREGLRRLGKAGTVGRAKREGDGKAAYALAAPDGV